MLVLGLGHDAALVVGPEGLAVDVESREASLVGLLLLVLGADDPSDLVLVLLVEEDLDAREGLLVLVEQHVLLPLVPLQLVLGE